MSEGHWYLAGGAAVAAGLVALALGEARWLVALLLLAGLAAAGVGLWLRHRRSRSVRVEIEDDHLHPIPVLDAPKGTYDLIAGMSVRVDNRRREPVGVRIHTLLYRRTPWQWDRPVSDARAVALLAPSVVPGRSAKSFFVRNYTRIPPGIDALTPRHFVKLLVETSDAGKSVRRVFLRERFELPRKSPAPARRPPSDGALLLPFAEPEGEPARPPRRSLGTRVAAALRRVGIGTQDADRAEIHRLGNGDDTFEGLIDEISTELEHERGLTRPARGSESSRPRGR